MTLSVIAAVFAVTAGAAPASGAAGSARACNAGARGYISNPSPVGIGVIQDWRGFGTIYGRGLYDAVLPAGQRTDCAAGFGWYDAEGYYIGPGYCAEVRYYNNGRFRDYELVAGGQHPLPPWSWSDPVHRWEVDPYRC